MPHEVLVTESREILIVQTKVRSLRKATKLLRRAMTQEQNYRILIVNERIDSHKHGRVRVYTLTARIVDVVNTRTSTS